MLFASFLSWWSVEPSKIMVGNSKELAVMIFVGLTALSSLVMIYKYVLCGLFNKQARMRAKIGFGYISDTGGNGSPARGDDKYPSTANCKPLIGNWKWWRGRWIRRRYRGTKKPKQYLKMKRLRMLPKKHSLPRVGNPPTWITMVFRFLDWCFASKNISNDMGADVKKARKKKKVKIIRTRRVSRHYKRYWGCTAKEGKKKRPVRWQRRVKIRLYTARRLFEEQPFIDMHMDRAAFGRYRRRCRRCRSKYPYYIYKDPLIGIWLITNTAPIPLQHIPSYDDISINYDQLPGLVTPRRYNRCTCDDCLQYQQQYCKLVFDPSPTVPIAKLTRSSASNRFITTQVMVLVIGLVLGMLCTPAAAMDMGDSGKSLVSKMPIFTGKKEDFVMWLAKFTALATLGMFSAAFARNDDGTFGEDHCPESEEEAAVLDPDDAGDAESLEAWKRNAKAFAAITICMPNKLFRIIASSNGLAKIAMKLLYQEYKPDDNLSRVEAERKYSAIRLTDNGNPRYILQRFAEIAHQHPNAAANEAKKISIILTAAPNVYQTVLTITQITHGESCTAEHLINAMEVLYRQRVTTGNNNNNRNNGSELAMAAPGNRAPKCWNCGKPGHRSTECRSPNTNNKYRPARTGGNSNGNNTNSNHNNNGSNNSNSNGNRNRRDVICHECGQRGHTRDRCFCLEANASRRPAGWRPPAGYRPGGNGTSGEQGQIAMDNNDCNGFELLLCSLSFPNHQDLLRDPNVWLCDTGASVHSTAHMQGMTNVHAPTGSSHGIVVGNNDVNIVEAIGDIPGTFHDKNGNAMTSATLQNVSYSRDNAFNLLSIPQLLLRSWTLTGDTDSISVHSPDGVEIKFDIIIPTSKGRVYAVYLKRHNEVMAVQADGTNIDIPQPKMTINEAHAKFGHCSETLTRKAAKAHGIELKDGPFTPCVACGMGKAKQRNVPKSTESDEPAVGERLHADISIIRKKVDNRSYVRPNWFMMVDAASGMKFSSFWNTKKAFIEPTCEVLHRWIERGHNIKIIRCDNAGENKLWEARCKSADWKLIIKFQYTAARTPQQNSQVEVGFAVIANRGRALMAAANVPEDIRRLIWNEAFQCATLLDGLMVVTINGVTKSRWEHWQGQLPSFASHLRTWGEAGVVKIRDLATPKVADRGTPCMFVGYSKGHPGDTYRMYDPNTGGVHDSRDVIWLRRMYYQKPLSPTEFQVPTDGLLRSEPVELDVINFDNVDDMEQYDVTPATAATVELEEDAHGDNDNDNEGATVTESENDDVNSNDPSDDPEPTTAPTTRSGRTIKPAARFDDIDWNEHHAAARLNLHAQNNEEEVEEFHDANQQPEQEAEEDADSGDDSEAIDNVNDDDSEHEEQELGNIYFDVYEFGPGELALVGASLGGGFVNTAELKPLNYEQAMSGDDKDKWTVSMDEEKDRFDKHEVVEPMPRSEVPVGTRIMDSTWACKKKSNGTYRARLNLRGFKQIEGEHYDAHSIASPVVNIITIHIVLALIAIVGWYAVLVDVRGAFLLGDWEKDRQVYMEVPKGWEHHYPPNTVLKLMKTAYGAKQSAKRYWLKCLKALDEMEFSRSQADPCLYYKWHAEHGLILMMSWVDDNIFAGTKAGVEHAKAEFFKHFECDDTGEMKEYIGNKIDRKDGMLKMTQPVLLQSFIDEFKIERDHKIKNPAVPGSVLHPTEGKLSSEDQFTYRSGTGKLLHLMKWSRPEIGNAVRELSRFMSGAGVSHMKAMYRVMNYCLNTSERGKVFKPRRQCRHEDIANFEFIVEGYSDSDYAKDPVKRRSVSGFCSFLEGCPVNTKSRMQPITSLSVTEAELVAATECAQDLIFIKNILESIGLKVRTPMTLNIDNSGCIDLICNWSAGGRTRHMDTRMYFLRELKEEEPPIVMPVYCPTELNRSDIFTKNVDSATFDEHVRAFCTDDSFD